MSRAGRGHAVAMTPHPAFTTTHSGHAALRKSRRSQPQQIYLITFVTHQRRPLFDDFAMGCAAASALAAEEQWTHARLLAWVLMPDHWHALVELQEGTSLSQLVQELKRESTCRLHAFHPDLGPV